MSARLLSCLMLAAALLALRGTAAIALQRTNSDVEAVTSDADRAAATAHDGGIANQNADNNQPVPPPVQIPSDTYGLEKVEDVTVLEWSDVEAYYGLLHHASQVSQEALRAAGREFAALRQQQTGLPPFRDMLRHPEAWRGQPVYMEGHILQTIEFEAADNPYGIQHLYESALYTEDSAHHPSTIVFLQKPDDLPIGGETVGSVAVSGYFLKLYVYPSSDKKTRKAPLILAKTITVFPTPKAVPVIPTPWLLAGLILILGLLVLGVSRSFHSDRRRLSTYRRKELDDDRPDFPQLG